MSKKIFLYGILVLALLAGGYFLLAGKISITEQTKQDEKIISGNLAQILATNADLNCEFSSLDEAKSMSGTLYIADKGAKLRGDFALVQPDMPQIDAHIIRDGEWNYTWGSFASQGIKSKVPEEKRHVLFEDESGNPIDNSLDFKCKSWASDYSMFTPPEKVSFLDVSALMMPKTENAKKAQN